MSIMDRQPLLLSLQETTDANSSPSSTTVPESATDSPPNSTTGGDSTSESTPSGLRRRLEDDFQESPEPPSKVPRLNTMDSFSFGSNSSDTPAKQQLFEDKQAPDSCFVEFINLNTYYPKAHKDQAPSDAGSAASPGHQASHATQ